MNIISDYKAYNLNIFSLIKGLFTLHPFYLNVNYRISHWLYSKKIPLLPSILRARGIKKFSADISPSADIGKGFRMAHTVGIVIGGKTQIGDFFECFQNVTIGGRDREIQGRYMPIIGNYVTAFSGSCLIGPIKIADGCQIGANSVLLDDVVNKNSVIVGIPGTLVKITESNHSKRSMKKER